MINNQCKRLFYYENKYTKPTYVIIIYKRKFFNKIK